MMAEGEKKNKRKGYWKDKHLSEETKQKIREALKGRVLSKEGIKKGRQGRLRYY
jgi:NUMOD3 motif